MDVLESEGIAMFVGNDRIEFGQAGTGLSGNAVFLTAKEHARTPRWDSTAEAVSQTLNPTCVVIDVSPYPAWRHPEPQ